MRDADVSGLTGFEPVELVEVKGGSSAPMYRHVDVPIGGAAVDEDRSSLMRSGESTCAACRSDGLSAIHGFVLEPGSWAGDDVFIARGLPGIVIATDRFRSVVMSHNLTNVDFVPTSAYEWDSLAPVASTHSGNGRTSA